MTALELTCPTCDMLVHMCNVSPMVGSSSIRWSQVPFRPEDISAAGSNSGGSVDSHTAIQRRSLQLKKDVEIERRKRLEARCLIIIGRCFASSVVMSALSRFAWGG